MSGSCHSALVESENNFPTGTGIASSASGFAALAVAASRAAGLDLDEPALSRLARRASGSACRSVPGGFVEWQAGDNDDNSYAFSIAPTDHWELVDCIAIISQTHKSTTSQEGHLLARSSPLQAARVESSPGRLSICRQAILQRDFDAPGRGRRAGQQPDARRDHDFDSTPALLAACHASGHPFCHCMA